ncbi:MAG: alpha-2-macroglobulin, partial [Ferruginibacter sp.]
QKQTNQWPTNRATAEACYALLLNGGDWLTENKSVTIEVGNTVILSTGNATEAGTGFFKKVIPGDQVQQGMGNITVKVQPVNNSTATSWGAVYWQYFEELDKIGHAATPLQLVKNVFTEKKTSRGPVLQQLKDGETLAIGDKVIVRIQIKVDRDMEYVHMKDLRAAAFEPVNVISRYKYQGGLGYYESTLDASTNFFFNWLPRGTYVFEYPMFVSHSGNFSNGITTIQCLYAPEFASHSNGIRINVAEKK